MIAIAMRFNDNVWIPPKGRPYWVMLGMPNAGPHLTDKRLKRFGLVRFLSYSFDKVWAESHKIARLKRRQKNEQKLK